MQVEATITRAIFAVSAQNKKPSPELVMSRLDRVKRYVAKADVQIEDMLVSSADT
jgi:hypothetical protein